MQRILKPQTMEKVKIYFVGVDEFNRPTFCSIDGKRFYCDIDHLVKYDESEDEIIRYYKAFGTSHIFYKGRMFKSEPEGDFCCVEIVSKEEAKKLAKSVK